MEEKKGVPPAVIDDAVDHLYTWLCQLALYEIQKKTNEVQDGAVKEGEAQPVVEEANPEVFAINYKISPPGMIEKDGEGTSDRNEISNVYQIPLIFRPVMRNLAAQIKADARTEIPISVERIRILDPLDEEGDAGGLWRQASRKGALSEAIKKRLHVFLMLYYTQPDLSQEELAASATAYLFDEIRSGVMKNHPTWSEEKITQEASRLFTEEFHRNAFASYDVRNDFKKAGVTWGYYRR